MGLSLVAAVGLAGLCRCAPPVATLQPGDLDGEPADSWSAESSDQWSTESSDQASNDASNYPSNDVTDASALDDSARARDVGTDASEALADATLPDATAPDGFATDAAARDGDGADSLGAFDGRVGALDGSETLDSGVASDGGRGLDGGSWIDGASVDGAVTSEAGRTCASGLGQGPVTSTAIHLDIAVHDPSMIWDGARYYLFATGGMLAFRSSPDLLSWTNAGSVFSAVPAWVATAIGSTPTDLWAPDISYFGGRFHVYYAGSTFGSNDSVIGLATTTSLQSPQWVDQGLIVRSTTADDFNAIDPSVTFDPACNPWLVFGSYWTGIKLRKLDATTGQLAADEGATYALASRGGSSIEGGSVISHNGYYYLFVSFGTCCAGVNSTYETMVGRASNLTGPYTNKLGVDMMTGAAEELLVTSGRYIGPGGGTAWRNGDSYLYVYHYYDGQDNGVSKLQIRPIAFDADNWIVLGAPLFP